MRRVLVALLFACAAPAHAGLLLTNLDSPLPGQPPGTWARVQAGTANNGDQATKTDFSLPYVGERTVSVVGVSAFERFTFSSQSLTVQAPEFSRQGRGATASNGEIIFGVDALQTVSISGAFSFEADRGEEMQFIAALTDLTTGALLMESRQGDNAISGAYELGGLLGNRGATFTGSLVNELVPGHTYRLSYILALSDFEATADRSLASGFVTVGIVAEPSSGSLAALSLVMVAGLGYASRGRSNRLASASMVDTGPL